jgi:hypothetical protein
MRGGNLVYEEEFIMIRKDKIISQGEFPDEKYKGAKFYFVVPESIQEPVSENICSSIEDYYNLMHLLRKSWKYKSYHLRISRGYNPYNKSSVSAGYNIYDKDNILCAWFGVEEKSEYIKFILQPVFYYKIVKEAYDSLHGKDSPIEVDDDENTILTKIGLKKIVKAKNYKEQKTILQSWLRHNVYDVLLSKVDNQTDATKSRPLEPEEK